MKAAQITKHSKSINLIINNVDMPVINEYEVLIKVKAAGGISSFDDAEKFIELGADRLGTSRLVKIMKNTDTGAGY